MKSKTPAKKAATAGAAKQSSKLAENTVQADTREQDDASQAASMPSDSLSAGDQVGGGDAEPHDPTSGSEAGGAAASDAGTGLIDDANTSHDGPVWAPLGEPTDAQKREMIAEHLGCSPADVLAFKLYDDRLVAVVHGETTVTKHTIERGDA
ncbi:hypothetical protein [Dyella sp. 20L07]|uniref:hypothetical protein n=1 Tax=Dyella sp. 20L07 TaxID=3384240 RepID=UPI003D2E45D0